MKKTTFILCLCIIISNLCFSEETSSLSFAEKMVQQIRIDVPTLLEPQISAITELAHTLENSLEAANEEYDDNMFERAAAKQIIYEEFTANLIIILTDEQNNLYHQAIENRRNIKTPNQE